ncbi:MAG: Xylulose kinase [Firmicutes bacterium]|nr:Xylulose kinase [Bacillota bacterium]
MRIATDSPILANYPATWCYVGVENMWVAGSATAGAGNCVAWIGKKILGTSNGLSLKELDAGARNSLRQGDAPIFLPFLVGERGPGWDDKKNAMFCELRMNHDIYDLYYAVLEGVLFNLWQCYEITIPIVGRTPKLISISGGIEESQLWLSMAASIFGLPVHTNGQMHASLLGTAYMGLRATGVLDSVKKIAPQIEMSYEPNPAQKEFFAQRFQRYLKYYQGETLGRQWS